ncbi:MAG: hypothetical protein AB7O88_17105 [Reyranellaceae bacterium]
MDTPFDINGDTPPPDFDVKKNSWTPAKYVRAVRHWITEIRKWQTGQAVIRAIQSNTIKIRPEPSTAVQHAHVDQRGNIRFTPMLYVRGNPPRFDFYAGNPRALNHNPDEVLLDEIVNAMLKVHKVDKNIALPKIDYLPTKKDTDPNRFLWFHRVEELYSILIVNIYVSEKNKSNWLYTPPPTLGVMRRDAPGVYKLRKDHATESDERSLPEPRSFVAHPGIRPRIRELMRPPLSTMCEEIAVAPAAFNPFRDILIDREPEEMLVRFFKAHDDSNRQFEYFQDTTAKLAAKLGQARFDELLAGVRGKPR